LAKKLEFANFSVQDCERKTQKVRDLYQDVGLEIWKADSDIQLVNREMIEVRRHMQAVEDHIQMMKDGGGVVLWPKPCLYLDLPEEVGGAIELDPCSFCNRWYTSFDVVLASCKHLYHPFCIAKLLESQKECVVCKEAFHPTWQRSFGFRSLQANVLDEAAKASMAKSMEELSGSLKDSFSLPIQDCKRIPVLSIPVSLNLFSKFCLDSLLLDMFP
jgi:hypothetical protein